MLNSVSDTSLSNDLVQETKRRLRSLEAEADVSCDVYKHGSTVPKTHKHVPLVQLG